MFYALQEGHQILLCLQKSLKIFLHYYYIYLFCLKSKTFYIFDIIKIYMYARLYVFYTLFCFNIKHIVLFLVCVKII